MCSPDTYFFCYLLMQEELCDLRLAERTALGEQFLKIMDEANKSNTTETMAYMAFYTDSKPDFVYVLVTSRGIDRATLLCRSTILLRAAMVAYCKDRGLVIADRDGAGFEVQLISGRISDPSCEKLAEEFFAKLAMSHVPVS